MAGIGFHLKELLKEETAQSTVSAYFYTAIVTAGPWLFSVFALSAMTLGAEYFAPDELINQFIGLAIYALGSTMILTGGTQMIITRHLADCLYEHREDRVLQILVTSWILGAILTAIFGVPAIWILEQSLSTSFLLWVLLLLCSLLWLTMIFVSTIKAYMTVVWAFVIGFGVAIPASLICGYYFALNGFVTGLNFGLSFTVFMLAGSVMKEFTGSLRPSWSLLRAHSQYKLLFWTGFFASAGIWADKVILWYTVGESVIGPLKTYPVYDGAMFLSYLTIIPSMSFFVMIIETDFYESYRRYFYLVEQKVSFVVLEHARQDMVKKLQSNGFRAAVFQIVITSFLLFMSPWVVPALGMDWLQWHMFRIGCMAAVLHLLTSLLGILLSYFDCRREYFAMALLFFIAVSVGTWISRNYFWYYGYGYLFAGMITAMVSMVLVSQRLKKLHFYTLFNPHIDPN